ncbi:TetR/AcrR family transcriptional regulator [Patulibacter minatonensis]|uniref:TetR/AcrR family transcriptional regulator n=1 Tax=Patulibacter minatonensis TaxID=298163 RepID=UPI0006864FC5|nr:TetR/AcrR family transcriptional regulator [Patulibacter minatonensis]
MADEPQQPEDAADSGIGRRRAAARSGGRADYEERRAAIVAAAATLFKRQGYARTTFADIAREVGSDRASLYYYVGGKDELLDAVVTDVVRANTAAAEAVRDGDGTAPEKLRELIVGTMRAFHEHYPMLYVYLQENLAHAPDDRQAWAQDMRAVNRRWAGAIEDVVREGLEAGTLRSAVPARVLANGIMGMVNWTNRWYDPERTSVDAEEIGTTYADVLLSGLAAPAAVAS